MIEKILVRRSPIPAAKCNLARSFDIIGDRWSLLILRSALYGVRRFDDFRGDTGAPGSVLSARLKKLIAAGLIEPREYQDEGQRKRNEYSLTPMGKSLALPFMAMTNWADTWLSRKPPPLTLRSKSTGLAIRVAFVDEKGRAVRPDDIATVVEYF
jgi:DNA-binding HxlR family transcriptional regulator